MKLLKNQRGFTLVELVVSIGVISLISSLVLSGVMSANTNNTTANIISFMDNTTSQAKEVFQLYPEDVLNGSTREEPYSSMAHVGVAIDQNGNNILGSVEYVTHYSDKLSILETGNPSIKYKLVFTFLPKDVNSVAGFSHQTVKYTMEANVYTNKQKTITDSPSYSKEALYTKTYEFDRITTNAFETLPSRNISVTFKPNGGKVLLNGKEQSSDTFTQKYYKDEYVYGGGRYVTAKKDKNQFIGWSTSNSSPDDRKLINPDTYKISNDQTLYAQYLRNGDIVDYRLQFNIGPDESWNLSNNEKDPITYFEKALPASASAPKIKEMGTTVDDFFKSNVVRKRGYKFLYWADSDGNKVTMNDRLDTQFYQLRPIFEKLADDRTEVITVNLMLDLSSTIAGNSSADTSKSRMYAVYPFTKMLYEVKFNKSTDSFDVIQTETIDNEMNKYGTLPDGLKDGDVLSTRTFNTKTDDILYFNSNGTTYKTLKDYVNSQRFDENDPFIIEGINLRLKASTFSLGDFYSNGNRDELTFSNGSKLNSNQAKNLFEQTDVKKASFEYKSDSKPILQKQNIQELKERVAQLSNLDVLDDMYHNIGSISYQNSGTTSYSSRDETHTIADLKPQIYARAMQFTYILPLNSILTQDSNWTRYTIDFYPDIAKIEGKNSYELVLRITPGSITWENAIARGSLLDEETVIRTGIPLYEYINDGAHGGAGYEVYNYISKINVKALRGFPNRNFDVSSKNFANTSDLAGGGETLPSLRRPYKSSKGGTVYDTLSPVDKAPEIVNPRILQEADNEFGDLEELLKIEFRKLSSGACSGACYPNYSGPFKKEVLELPWLSYATRQTKDPTIDDFVVGDPKGEVIYTDTTIQVASFEKNSNLNYLPPFIKSTAYQFK